jgi:hypothetical protein
VHRFRHLGALVSLASEEGFLLAWRVINVRKPCCRFGDPPIRICSLRCAGRG